MIILLLGLLLFLGTHSIGIVAPEWRERIKSTWGPGRWRGVYALVSAAGFALIIWGFGIAREHPVIWYAPPAALHTVTRLMMAVVMPLVFAAYLPGRIQRATKHPLLAAVKIWAFAHLLANGTAADVLLFGGFLVWAVAERIALKRRPKTAPAALAPSRWNDVIAVIAGLALYAWLLLWLHVRMFGVSPLA